MSESPKLSKGFALEETLRAYFLRAGFFVVRGVPVSFEGNELTDVDLWMYERPTGTSRRIQIADAKDKQRPKAVERLFWTKGLAETLGVDGAHVATTDSRPFVRKLATKLGLSIIDGGDLKRIQASTSISLGERLTDEELVGLIRHVDGDRRSHALQDERIEVLSSLSDGFGPSSLVRALECFSRLSHTASVSHPGSKAAEASTRLSFLAAAIAVASLDYLSVASPFRSVEERRDILLGAVRYGVLHKEDRLGAVETALSLVRKYAANGPGIAASIEAAVRADFDSIPAEIVADQAARFMKDGQLFAIARELETACYKPIAVGFDGLIASAKSMIGALLDYSGISRSAFAASIPLNGVDQVLSTETDKLDLPKASQEKSPQRSIF